MTTTWVLLISAAILVLTAGVVFTLRSRSVRRRAGRQHAVRAVLDAADALEDRLRVARDEIEAVAGDYVDDPVRDAMREMLRQRLWLRDHGEAASIDQLAEVRAEIDAARGRIELQLSRIERARAPSP
ncbi:MAG: hypothetical protein KY442_06040 [Proteobacteria bacterium]|nr:hypothetical protein [Pseudomonadota bacterium]